MGVMPNPCVPKASIFLGALVCGQRGLHGQRPDEKCPGGCPGNR